VACAVFCLEVWRGGICFVDVRVEFLNVSDALGYGQDTIMSRDDKFSARASLHEWPAFCVNNQVQRPAFIVECVEYSLTVV